MTYTINHFFKSPTGICEDLPSSRCDEPVGDFIRSRVCNSDAVPIPGLPIETPQRGRSGQNSASSGTIRNMQINNKRRLPIRQYRRLTGSFINKHVSGIATPGDSILMDMETK